MSDLLTTLKFVQGAVARKNLVPEMTHFQIKDGRITAFNGRMALSSPIDFNINCNPKAEPMIKAIAGAESTIALSMTPAGRLRIASGRVRVLVECIEPTLEPVAPEGTLVQLTEAQSEALVKAANIVLPFIGDDAARPWTNGALFQGQSIYATCNVVIVERWLGFNLTTIPLNVPYEALKELVRVKEFPNAIQYNQQSISFLFPSGRWIRSQLLPAEWPDVEPILSRPAHCNTPVDPELFDCVEKLKPFLSKEGKIIFSKGTVRTHDDAEEGAIVDTGLPDEVEGVYAYDMFMLLKSVIKTGDLTSWPNPCMFYGDLLRGAIIGRRR